MRRLISSILLGALCVSSCRLAPEDSPIVRLAQRCDADGTEALLEQGADPNHVDEVGAFPVQQAVVGSGAGPGGAGCGETLAVLFEAGASPDTLTSGESLFYAAASKAENPDVVTALVNAGVDHCVPPGSRWKSTYVARDLVALAVETERPAGLVDALTNLGPCSS